MHPSRHLRASGLLVMVGFVCLSMAGLTTDPGAPTILVGDGEAAAPVAPMVVGGAAGACGVDLYEVASLAGGTLCTHGPDAPALAGAVAPVTEATAGIQCYGSGTDGARVQFVYVHTSAVNHLAALRQAMRTRAAQMDAMVNGSAAQTGGRRHIRFVTDANCNLDIDDVVVPDNAVSPSGFSEMVSALIAKGYADPDRKYLIFADTNGADPSLCYGMATLWGDDHPASDNFNNTHTGYARLDETCLRTTGFDGRTEAHELMHTLGAVQRSAPHASPNGHCLDDADRMCYDDDGPGAAHVSVVCSSSNELRFDCHNDDYFYASRPCGQGGWLATHWNTADNRWLESTPGGTRTAPGNDSVTAPTPLPGYSGVVAGSNVGATTQSGERAHDGKPGGRSVWFSWTAPVAGPVSFDTCGSDADTLLAVYTGPARTPLALTAVASGDDDPRLGQQSRADFTATAGTTYLVAVDGKNADQGAVALRWGAPYHGYPDVRIGARYEAALSWARSRRVAAAYPDGTFRPTTEATRSQAVSMLWQLVDHPAGAPHQAFSDVPANAAYRAALDWAVHSNVASGNPDGTFRPDGTVKRGALAEMLWNLAGRPAAPAAAFADIAPTDKIAAPVGWATSEGLLRGYADNTFRPKSAMTRAKVTTALYNLARTSHAWKYYPGIRPPSTVVFTP